MDELAFLRLSLHMAVRQKEEDEEQGRTENEKQKRPGRVVTLCYDIKPEASEQQYSPNNE